MPSTSQGFDLDALPVNSKEGDEVVYEVGGGASAVRAASSVRVESSRPKGSSSADARLELSEEAKVRGNEAFLAKNFLEAYDAYTEAIESCPGLTGEELLALKSKHEDSEREKAVARHAQETTRRRRTPPDAADDIEASSDMSDDAGKYTPIEFQPPAHEFAHQLAVYHSNRAACSLHLEHYDDAIKDCDIALMLNPRYTKALIRRMSAYESTLRTEEALRDAKAAMAYEPTHVDIKKHVQRLEKIENERLEKLKEETLGKVCNLLT